METIDSQTQNKSKTFSFRLDKYVFKRLNNHIQILKCLEHKEYSKKRWLEAAILEKLQEEEMLGDNQAQKDHFISIQIQQPICTRIEKRIQIAKKFRLSYSVKKWLLEAIIDKLEREDEKAKTLLLKLKKINDDSL